MGTATHSLSSDDQGLSLVSGPWRKIHSNFRQGVSNSGFRSEPLVPKVAVAEALRIGVQAGALPHWYLPTSLLRLAETGMRGLVAEPDSLAETITQNAVTTWRDCCRVTRDLPGWLSSCTLAYTLDSGWLKWRQ